VKAFAYLRLSRDRDTSTSIEKQREATTAFCDSRDWTLVDTFKDVDVSGRKESRPSLDAMLSRLDEADVIVFHRLDRIMRTVTGFAKLLERCRDAGVELVSATEPFDTSSAIGRALVWLLASVAEIEAENTSLRMKATHEHLLRQGRTLGQARSFGWRHDADEHTYVQVPEEVEVVRLMVDRFLAGAGTQAIATGLQDGTLCGVPLASTYGGTWTANAVKRVLESPMLVGFQRRHGRFATKEPVLPPILDVDTYDRVQKELGRRRRTLTRVREGSGELTGVLVCGECGDRMYVRSNGDRWSAYICSGRKGHAMAISAPFAHEEIARRLFERLDAEALATAEAEVLEGELRPSELRTAVTRAEWGLAEIRRDYYERQRLTREDFDMHEQEMIDQLDRLREKAAAEEDDRSTGAVRLGELGDLPGLWPSLEVGERREVFALALRRVRVVRAPRIGNRNNPDRLVTTDADWLI